MYRDRRNSIYDGMMYQDQSHLSGIAGILLQCVGRRSSRTRSDFRNGLYGTCRIVARSSRRRAMSTERNPYGSKIQHVTAKDQHVVIPVGESREVKIGIDGAKMKLWVTREPDWVPTVISGWSRTKYRVASWLNHPTRRKEIGAICGKTLSQCSEAY